MRNKLKNILGWKLAPYILLLILISAYFIIFLSTSFSQYNRFWYGNFDLGIPDQGIWLLSQNKEPFVTARGMHIFADHSEYIKIFVAPVFLLWNDAKALILLQTLALSLAAIPLFFAIKKRGMAAKLKASVCKSINAFASFHNKKTGATNIFIYSE